MWSVPHTHSTTTTAFACIFQCFFCQQVQQSCNSSSASPDTSEEPCPTDMVKMTKSKTFQAYLPTCHRTYSCIHCRAHLANHDELISKSFQGSQGRAYLFNSVVNVGCGPAEERVLLTGLHAVADIYCENCKTTLGWKYEHAFESSQKYKEGKFIIELAHMIKDNGWEWRSSLRLFCCFLLFFLTWECSLLNCGRRVIVHPSPHLPPPAPVTFLTKKHHLHLPRLLHVHTHPPAHRESEQTATNVWSDLLKNHVTGVSSLLWRFCVRRGSRAFGFDPLTPPPPHRTTLTSDCGDMATTMRMERETSMKGRFFLLLMDDFFNVVCFS